MESQQFLTPQTPLHPEKRSVRLENGTRYSCMVMKHTRKIWTFLDHFFTYLKFYVYFQRGGNQDRKSDFFFAIFTRKSAFSLFYTGNMIDFHFLPIWSLLPWRVTYNLDFDGIFHDGDHCNRVFQDDRLKEEGAGSNRILSNFETKRLAYRICIDLTSRWRIMKN